jgi:helix-turn-helix protein
VTGILGLLSKLTERLIKADVELRRQYPYRFATGDILFIENVAEMLGCSVDHVRRIPRSELAASRGAGRRLLYLREDVIRYVRLYRDAYSRGDQRQAVAALSELGKVAPLFDAAAAARRIRRKDAK